MQKKISASRPVVPGHYLLLPAMYKTDNHFLKDRTVKVWRASDGIICRNLGGHAHWINTLALNTDYALRTSCFDPKTGCGRPETEEEVCFACFAWKRKHVFRVSEWSVKFGSRCSLYLPLFSTKWALVGMKSSTFL